MCSMCHYEGWSAVTSIISRIQRDRERGDGRGGGVGTEGQGILLNVEITISSSMLDVI